MVQDGAAFPRSRLDELTEQAKKAGAAGLAWFRVVESGAAGRARARRTTGAPPVRGGAVRLRERTMAEPGDLILAVSDDYATACTVLGTLRTAIGGAAGRPGAAPLRLGRRLPHVRAGRRRHTAAGAPPLHHAVPRGHGAADDRSVHGALAGLRPRAQRLGARLGQRAYPSPRDPGAGVRGPGHRAGGGRGALRLPARRVPLRRAAARGVRLRGRPPGGGARRGGEHPRGHRLSEDAVRHRPPHRCTDAAAGGEPRRARHPRRRAAGRRRPRRRAEPVAGS